MVPRTRFTTHAGIIVNVNNYVGTYPEPPTEQALEGISYILNWLTPHFCDETNVMKEMNWEMHQKLLSQMRLITALGGPEIYPGMSYCEVAPLIEPYFIKMQNLLKAAQGQIRLSPEEVGELRHIFEKALTTSDCFTNEHPLMRRLVA